MIKGYVNVNSCSFNHSFYTSELIDHVSDPGLSEGGTDSGSRIASAVASGFQAIHGMFYCPHRVPSPAPVKYALKVKGVPVGDVRLPLVPVNSDEARFIIEDLLNRIDPA